MRAWATQSTQANSTLPQLGKVREPRQFPRFKGADSNEPPLASQSSSEL